jgi:hypothetical protein
MVLLRGRSVCNLRYLFFALLTGCANLNDPYGYNSPYPPPPAQQPQYYGGPSFGNPSGYYSSGDPFRRERRELERERERLEDERRRLERERKREDALPPPQPPQYSRPSPQNDRCPKGFSPSERKCTQEERRRGCRDMRLPSGLGCVDRR